MNNTSGMGKETLVPPEINKWNWGAFFLNWIWGIGNKSYITFLMFVPFFFIIIPFVSGFKGNTWAWRNKKWDSIDQFINVQRKWSIAGFIIIPSFIVFIVLINIAVTFLIEDSDSFKLSFQKVSSSPEIQEIFGSHIKTGSVSGSINISGSKGSANLSYSITGQKNEGVVYAIMEMKMRQWEIKELAVKINEDQKIIQIVEYSNNPQQ